MRVYIYIHFGGEIVEKFQFEFESIIELQELLDYARYKYCKNNKNDGTFCFDVMFIEND